jgi:hypothetical protein
MASSSNLSSSDLAMFKVGDKVKFLNDVGEAVVVRVLSSTEVEVEDTHGLVAKYRSKELVPVAGESRAPVEAPAAAPSPPPVQGTAAPLTSLPTEKLPEIALIFLSGDPSEPERGDLDVYLSNNSDHHILFNVAAKEENGFFSLFHGEVKRGEMQHLRPIRRQDVDIFSQTMVDCIFFLESDYQHREAFSAKLKLKVTRFVRRENYRHLQSLGGHALVVSVERPPDAVGQAALSVRPQVNVPVRSGHRSLPRFEDEIDLHIEKLTADHRSLTNHEMLMMQIGHFHRHLDHAILNNYVQIVFIHGVGSGRLKEEIRRSLREHGHRFEDGPHHRYGVGATVVLLK